jgi:hypothetical protein
VGIKAPKVEEGSQNMGKIFEIPINPKNGSSTTLGSAPTKNGRKKYQPTHAGNRKRCP